MAPQEIFDTVVRHLAQQGTQSVSKDVILCAYRGVGGRKCAAGVLIPDESYVPAMEGMKARNLPLKFDLPEWFIENVSLIQGLQIAHDREWLADDDHPDPDKRLVARLNLIAEMCGLNSSVVGSAFA